MVIKTKSRTEKNGRKVNGQENVTKGNGIKENVEWKVRE